MSRTIEINHSIHIAVHTVGNLNIAAVHIGSGQGTISHIGHLVDILHQVSAGNRIAILIGKFFNRVESLLGQINIEGIVVRSETGVMAIYRQRFKQISTLQDGGKVAILLTRLQILAHHLACKGVVVRCIHIVATVEYT